MHVIIDCESFCEAARLLQTCQQRGFYAVFRYNVIDGVLSSSESARVRESMLPVCFDSSNNAPGELPLSRVKPKEVATPRGFSP